ncbi:MAG TPA: hypothetical protein VFM43_08465 [Gaiellaceae bacterium]|nr:hypothetical protein [Gaiellaceae bacterium]
MPGRTRIEAARRRAKAAKRAVALVAAVGFAVVLGLARQGHPAGGTSPARAVSHTDEGRSSSVDRSDDSDSDDSTLGGGTLAQPSNGSPPATTHTS